MSARLDIHALRACGLSARSRTSFAGVPSQQVRSTHAFLSAALLFSKTIKTKNMNYSVNASRFSSHLQMKIRQVMDGFLDRTFSSETISDVLGCLYEPSAGYVNELVLIVK
jgi:hypothetical protein